MSQASSLKHAKLREPKPKHQLLVDADDEAAKENVFPAVEVQYCQVFNECDMKQESQFPVPTPPFSVAEKNDENENGCPDIDRQNFRRQYTPRISGSRMTTTVTPRDNQNVEKVEYNSERVMMIEPGGGDENFQFHHPSKMELVEQQAQHHTKNYVIDYANLRRSGYFLSCDKNNNSLLKTGKGNSSSASKSNHVENWLDSLPLDSVHLKYSSDDLMGEKEFQKHPNKVSMRDLPNDNEEEKLKRYLIKRGKAVRYTSTPVPTLTYKQIDSILEPANTVIYEYLEKFHKEESESSEHDYVCGTLDGSSFRNNHKASNANPDNSWFERMVNWCLSLLNAQDVVKDPSDYFGKGNRVLLEPYRGPVGVNGAKIDSGAAQLMGSKGIIGTVVEEVKAALQGIYEALRYIPSVSLSKQPVQLASQQKNRQEDVEIVRLTKILKAKQFRKNSTFRTVFGLRNPTKIPPNFRFTIRRSRSHSFLRAVDGWIQRRSHGRHRHRHGYRILNNLANTQVPANTRQPAPRLAQEPVVTSASVLSALRSLNPFQITPTIPSSMPSSQNQQCHEQLQRFGQQQHSLNSNPGRSPAIPTRYQILRNFSKYNRKGRTTNPSKFPNSRC